jgi:pyruvate dehydrogenase E2 component (dihydrolipoamide acetyltransferase)
MSEVRMPKLSDSMTEGTLIRWLVDDGAEVEPGDELAEIETDKAVMTYEAEAAGTVLIVLGEGETAAVGAVIARLMTGGEPETSGASGEATARADGAGTAALRAPRLLDAGRANGRPRANASPVARRAASVLGVDLRNVIGSGPEGRIVKRDVEWLAGESSAIAKVATPPDRPATEPGRLPSGDGAEAASEIAEPSRLQLTIARRMALAKATMPDFALTVDVDMDPALELREQFKSIEGTLVPSLNDFVVRAASLALRSHPRANGSFREEQFVLHRRIHVGIAVAAADALLVPVVADADRLSLGEIASQTRRLGDAARAGALTAADVGGGTFTVSNLGMFGISAFTAVLNPPQAAILAVGEVQRRAVVRGEELAIGHQMTMTLTCDHRILYGAEAAAFLGDIRLRLEQPIHLCL